MAQTKATSIAELHATALRRVLRQETWRRERIVNHYRFALFAAIGLAEWVGRAGHDHEHLTMMPFLFLGWGVTIEALNLTWLRKEFRAWFPAAITTLDIVILTAAMQIVYAHAVRFDEPLLREIERAMMGLLVLLSVNVIRFSWRTSLWSGLCAVAALGYLRVYSGSLGGGAILTDLLIISGVVALLIYANRSFRIVTERLLFDLREAQERRLSTLKALVAGVTHEVNSPLGALSANTQLSARAAKILAEQIEGMRPDFRRAVESLEKTNESSQTAVTRISSVIRMLRDFARVDEAEVKQADLRHGLDTCLELLSDDLGDRIEVVRRYNDLPEIVCRPAQLNQAFMHLLTNAVQSIHGPGTITIEGSRGDACVIISFKDTGRGIEEKRLKGIFDLQLSRRGERVGMGLGLPISHSILQDHGGTIDIQSTLGAGTTVTLRLPIR